MEKKSSDNAAESSNQDHTNEIMDAVLKSSSEKDKNTSEQFVVKETTQAKVFWHAKFMQKDEDLDINGATCKLLFGEIAIAHKKTREAFWKSTTCWCQRLWARNVLQ